MGRFPPAVVSLVALIAPTVLGPVPGVAQYPVPAELEEAYFAWDRGDYPAALSAYIDLVEDTEDPALIEAVARATGELHAVSQVAPDGSGVGFSPDGRWIHYRVEEGGREVTRIVEAEEPFRSAGVLPTRAAAVSPGGAVAWIEVVEDGRILEARRTVERAREEGDGAAVRAALQELAGLELLAGSLRFGELGEPGGVGPGESGVRAVRSIPLDGWVPVEVAYGPAGEDLYVATISREQPGRGAVLQVGPGGGEVEEIWAGEGAVGGLLATAGGDRLVFQRERPSGRGDADRTVMVMDLVEGMQVGLPRGRAPALSRDGGTLVYLRSTEIGTRVEILALADPPGQTDPVVLHETENPVDHPTLSPDGALVAWQERPQNDWEIYLTRVGQGGRHAERPATDRGPAYPPAADGPPPPTRLSWEIQHDQFPAFVDGSTLLAMKGEFRHRRAHLHDLDGGSDFQLFDNNLVRTISPEYEWVVGPDGSSILVVAERDGNTISPEQGVYLVDLTRTVGRDELLARLHANLEAENDLRERGRRAFEPIAERVAARADAVSVGRIFSYADALFRFGSKHISQPGNRGAVEYLRESLEAFGYDVELQWFEPQGFRTANVVATLEGTENPALVYVISSHFDSVLRSPGADDNSSGTTALLEAARVLAEHPQPATIRFAFLTGEESGLLGAREFVRRAEEEGDRIVGVLNNDMIGWTRSHRLDNTIRYSNDGIRDLQHAAAIQFSDLITYDARYYRATDAAVFYDAYGDIVGGIGSFPVLGNPRYHQSTDILESIDQRLVAAVSRTTVASIMKLASSPGRLVGLEVEESDGQEVVLRWEPAPEAGVTGYRVRWGPANGPFQEVLVEEPAVAVPAVSRPGTTVRVRAVGANGLEGWDWAVLDIDG